MEDTTHQKIKTELIYQLPAQQFGEKRPKAKTPSSYKNKQKVVQPLIYHQAISMSTKT